MGDDPNHGQRQAMAWFHGLTPVPQAFALAELADGGTVGAMRGSLASRMSRHHAETLIRSGDVRRAPAKQAACLASHRLVVVDPEDGFPVQLETKPR